MIFSLHLQVEHFDFSGMRHFLLRAEPSISSTWKSALPRPDPRSLIPDPWPELHEPIAVDGLLVAAPDDCHIAKSLAGGI